MSIRAKSVSFDALLKRSISSFRVVPIYTRLAINNAGTQRWASGRTLEHIAFKLAQVRDTRRLLGPPLLEFALDLLHDLRELREIGHDPLGRLAQILACLHAASRFAQLGGASTRAGRQHLELYDAQSGMDLRESQ